MTRCGKPALFAALWLAVLHLPAPAYGDEAAAPPTPPGVWTQVTPMSTPRWGAAAATGADGRIYVFGGFNDSGFLNSAEVYNPKNKKWKPIAPMPTARDLAAAATGPDGKIYVMGGFFEPCPPPPPIGFPDCRTLNTVEAYDPATNTWTTVAPMPTARFGHGAATGPDGRIYAIGGGSPLAIGGASNTVEAYNPATNSWATVAPMSTPRLYLGAASGADGRIYAIGGRTTDLGTTEVNTVEALNTTTGLWEPVAPMKTPRSRLAAAASGADGRIYAIAGVDTLGTPDLAEVQALPSGPLATWQDVAPLDTPRQQLAAAADGNGRVYTIGGSSGPSYLSSVEVFTP